MKKKILLILIIGTFVSCSNGQIKKEEGIKYEQKISKNIDIVKELSNKKYENVISILKGKTYKNYSTKEKQDFIYYLGKKEKVEQDLEILKIFLKKNRKFDFDNINESKETFVSLLIQRGSKLDYEMLVMMKKARYDFNYKDSKGNNYLVESILFNFNEMSIDIIKFLLEEGIDVNEENKDHMLPLTYLLVNKYRENNIEILELLVKYGLKIDKRMGLEKETALMWICNSTQEYLDTTLIEPLLKNGANPNLLNNNKKTPLVELILNNQIKNKTYYAEKLITYKANLNYIDRDGISPLLYIIANINQKENQDLLPLLISNGADINYKDTEGNNLLAYATMYSEYEIFYKTMEFLLISGLDPNEINNRGQNSIIITTKSKKSDYHSIELLNLFGGEIDKKDKLGNTALSYASVLYTGKREKEIIEYLINNGADIYSENIQEYNPLMLSVFYSKKEKGIEGIETLLPYYPSLDVQCSFGYTPLMIATQFTNESVSLDAIDTLVNNGANINFQQEDGTTALMIAAINTSTTSTLDTVKRMIKLGANMNLRIKKEWFDEENNVKWEVGDNVITLAQKYMNISSNKETIDYLKSIK